MLFPANGAALVGARMSPREVTRPPVFLRLAPGTRFEAETLRRLFSLLGHTRSRPAVDPLLVECGVRLGEIGHGQHDEGRPAPVGRRVGTLDVNPGPGQLLGDLRECAGPICPA